MNGSNKVRVWLCDCGRVHLESKHCRVSLTPAEFLNLLRRAADKDGAGVVAPQQPSYLDEACTNTTASRAVRRLLLTETVSVTRA